MIRNMIFLLSAALLIACQPQQPIVGSVNGRPITQAEFQNYLAFKRIDASDERRRETVLEDYLQREALADVIEQQGVLDKDMIAAELNEFRKEALISRYFDDYLRETVSDEAVRNYYTTHSADYQDRKVRVSHILLRTNRNMSEPERLAKLTTIQEAHSRIYAGESFADVAMEYSEDAVSAKKGGDLGWLKEGAIDPRFSETIFSIEPNEPTEPFETPFGFHVVMVTDGPMVVKRPFDAVKGDIRYKLRGEARKAELARLLEQARVEVE